MRILVDLCFMFSKLGELYDFLSQPQLLAIKEVSVKNILLFDFIVRRDVYVLEEN